METRATDFAPTGAPETSRTAAQGRLDLAAALAFAWASLAAVDLLPLRDPTSSVISAWAGALAGLALQARGHLGASALAIAALLGLGAAGAPPEIGVAAALAAAVSLGRRSGRASSARLALATGLAAFAAGSLRRSFDPLLLDAPLLPGGTLHEWTAHLWREPHAGEVAPAVFGWLLLPVGLAGVLASGAQGWLRALGAAGLVAALFAARDRESAWPLALAALFVPVALCALATATRAGAARHSKPAGRLQRWFPRLSSPLAFLRSRRAAAHARGSRSRFALDPARGSAAAWLALSAAALALAWLSSGASRPPQREGAGSAAAAGFANGAGSASSLASATSAAPSDSAPLVGFVAAMHGTFDALPLPEDAPEDPSLPPRFGQFRLLLERLGARTVDVATPSDLAARDFDALVTINLSGAGAGELVAPLRAAVEGGADLLVLADHTDMFEQCAPTNALLAGTGVELRFDSAVPRGLGAGWVGSVGAGRDALFGAHRDGSAFGWGVGCSLSVAEPARVLAAGTRAFLDAGNRAKAGGLGNLARDRHEPLGGFALAASARLGRGRVLVCGDTSALQDTALLDGAPFARRLCSWLLGGGEPSSELPGDASLALALLTLLFAAALGAGALPTRVALPALAALGLGEALSEARMRAALDTPEPPGPRLELLAGWSTGVAPERGRLGALVELAASRGLRTSVARAPEVLPEDGALLLVDPWTRLEARDARELLAFVERGGRLVLLVGERGGRSAEPLLAELGLALGLNLGWGAESAWEGPLADLPGRPGFYSSLELVGPGVARADVLASAFGRPVALRGRRGAGEWLVVADGGIALDRHVEQRQGGSQRGRVTLQHLLDVVLEDLGQPKKVG